MRILVVEDDPILLDGLTVGLSLHRMAIDGVSTCQDACAALACPDPRRIDRVLFRSSPRLRRVR